MCHSNPIDRAREQKEIEVSPEFGNRTKCVRATGRTLHHGRSQLDGRVQEMRLASFIHPGSCTALAPTGSGEMGDVYEARDSNLAPWMATRLLRRRALCAN